MFYRLFIYFEDKIILCVSEALMTEYYHVLRRLKFAVYYDFASRAEALLADFEAKSAMCIPVISLNLISEMQKSDDGFDDETNAYKEKMKKEGFELFFKNFEHLG